MRFSSSYKIKDTRDIALCRRRQGGGHGKNAASLRRNVSWNSILEWLQLIRSFRNEPLEYVAGLHLQLTRRVNNLRPFSPTLDCALPAGRPGRPPP